jgi:hypothetical protein
MVPFAVPAPATLGAVASLLVRIERIGAGEELEVVALPVEVGVSFAIGGWRGCPTAPIRRRRRCRHHRCRRGSC